MLIRKFFSKNTEKLILFISGVIASAIVSGLLEKTIVWSQALLIVSIVILVLASTFLFQNTNHRIQKLADSLEIAVQYIEEPYSEDDKNYQGRIYEPMIKLMDDARKEILVLGTAYVEQDQVHKTSSHPSRKKYLDTIENNVRRHQGESFKYIRILQVPKGTDSVSISKIVGDTTAKHCYQILELAQKKEHFDNSLDILRIETQRMGSFLVIDRRYVIIEIDDIDSNGNTFANGFMYIDDRGGKVAEIFARYFNKLERRANELSKKDFNEVLHKPKTSKIAG